MVGRNAFIGFTYPAEPHSAQLPTAGKRCKDVRPCRRDPSQKHDRRRNDHESRKPSRARNESVFAPAQEKSRRVVAVGTTSAGGSKANRQTNTTLGRLRSLPLVPRDGARKFRGRRHRRGDE